MFSVIRERMYSLVDRNRETTKPNTRVFFLLKFGQKAEPEAEISPFKPKRIEILLIEPEILNRT